VNASGNVKIHNDYDAFGTEYQSKTCYAGGNIAETDIPRYGYTCQEKEPIFADEQESKFAGLMYYNSRWYDTSTGRFLSEDLFSVPLFNAR
jgi:RHS repeat-associated protein